jgi:hypothetical protein
MISTQLESNGGQCEERGGEGEMTRGGEQENRRRGEEEKRRRVLEKSPLFLSPPLLFSPSPPLPLSSSQPERNMSIKRQFTREQRTTIIYGMLAFAVILVILQLWLLTATMNAYLGGDEGVIWPAAAASLLCLLLNAGLLRYLYYIERVRR